MSHVYNKTPTCATWGVATCPPTNSPHVCFPSLCHFPCCCRFFFLEWYSSSSLFLWRNSKASMAFSLRTKSFGFGEGGDSLLQSWNEIDESDQWQRGIYYALCVAYASVSFVALVRHSLTFSRENLGFHVMKDGGWENWTIFFFLPFPPIWTLFCNHSFVLVLVLVWTYTTRWVSHHIKSQWDLNL